MPTDAQGAIRGAGDTRQNRELRVKACTRTLNLPMLHIPNSMVAAGM